MTQSEMARTIAALEKRVRQLETQLSRVPIYSAGGGSGQDGTDFEIQSVSTFPAIPSVPTIIYHTVTSQMWGSSLNLTRWYPMWGWTADDGAPD